MFESNLGVNVNLMHLILVSTGRSVTPEKLVNAASRCHIPFTSDGWQHRSPSATKQTPNTLQSRQVYVYKYHTLTLHTQTPGVLFQFRAVKEPAPCACSPRNQLKSSGTNSGVTMLALSV